MITILVGIFYTDPSPTYSQRWLSNTGRPRAFSTPMCVCLKFWGRRCLPLQVSTFLFATPAAPKSYVRVFSRALLTVVLKYNHHAHPRTPSADRGDDNNVSLNDFTVDVSETVFERLRVPTYNIHPLIDRTARILYSIIIKIMIILSSYTIL